MSKYKTQGFGSTFRNARKGFRLVIKSERNVRIHLAVGALVMALAIFLHFNMTKFIILLFAISFVIIAEMFNTAIEFTLDSYYHNRYNRMVGMAKDISAGAVMLATVTSIIVGLLVFGQAFVEMIIQ